MKIKDVRFSLSEAVTPLLLEHGFADRNHSCEFSRKFEGLFWFFEIHVYAETGWFFTKPSVGAGHPVLNKKFNEILQPKDRVRISGPTVGLGFGIANEHTGRGYYTIENADDIISAAAKIKSDFLEIALPYYEKNKSLEALEKSLNPMASDGSYVSTTNSAACMGLIAAQLCGRPDFAALADFHYKFHYNLSGKIELREFAARILKVKEFYLNSRMSNSGFGVPMLSPKS